MAVRQHLRLLPDTPAALSPSELVDSYRRLSDVFHEVLSEESLDALLVRIADALADLIPHDSLTIYETDETKAELVPVLARDQYAEEILRTPVRFREGITGWAACNREAVLANQAHLDPRVRFVPGTPIDPEALISVPLIARSRMRGVLNVYRMGEEGAFAVEEFELAKRFGDAAALALDNAKVRARLEHQVRTDSLTGLFDHRTFHEELRSALRGTSRTQAPVAVLMLDIDDFKHVNDVHGHAIGDALLQTVAHTLRSCVRPGDVPCRLGGEEFGVIMRTCDGQDATWAAERVLGRLADADLPGSGRITVSIGLAFGPEHAMNPRELAACAEAAMMTAKARGKNRIVRYEEGATERPEAPPPLRDGRTIAHMKMLRSLSGKLVRLNDVREIGDEIAAELRSLIDYHNCRVFVVDGDDLVPIAFRGELASEQAALPLELLRTTVGSGITGRAAELGTSLLVGDASRCEFGNRIAGTPEIEESLLAVPLRYGSRVAGVIVVSKLGLDQFDEDDLRLLEVLAGHASVAVENARLHEVARREAENAAGLLELGRELAAARGLGAVVHRLAALAAKILGSPQVSVWLEEDGWLVPHALHGYSDVEREDVSARALDSVTEETMRESRRAFLLRVGDDAWSAAASVPAAPIAVGAFEVDGRLGCIAAAAPPEGCGERQLRLLDGLAHQAQLAVANALARDELERTLVVAVERD